eukprot:9344700-Pyramimonas_sp.AAC.1
MMDNTDGWSLDTDTQVGQAAPSMPKAEPRRRNRQSPEAPRGRCLRKLPRVALHSPRRLSLGFDRLPDDIY